MLNYVWTDPSGLVTVRLSLSVLARLVGPLPALGGLLRGTSEFQDGRHVISVENFEPFRTEEFPEAVRRYADAVGIYRVQTRRESRQIDADDAALFSQHFAWPESVFLMIHPRLRRAAFFDPEGGKTSPLHDFAFQVSDSPEAGKRRISRAHWPIEVLALVAGIVAGAVLFQRLQQPPVVVPPLSQIAASTEAPPLPPVEIPDSSPIEPPAVAPKPTRHPARSEADRWQNPVSRPSPFAAPPKPAMERKPAPAPPVASAVAPPPVIATTPAPVRSRPREPEPDISVQSEPVAGSRLGTMVDRIPLLRRLHRQAESSVPPSPLHRVNPELTASERAELTDPIQVNVRVYVDEKGKVQYAELASAVKRHPNLASAAVFASRRWDFTPAVQDGQPVPGEVILHFHFAPPPSLAEASQD